MHTDYVSTCWDYEGGDRAAAKRGVIPVKIRSLVVLRCILSIVLIGSLLSVGLQPTLFTNEAVAQEQSPDPLPADSLAQGRLTVYVNAFGALSLEVSHQQVPTDAPLEHYSSLRGNGC